MRSAPNILPSVKLPNFGNILCFSCFSCFTWKKEENLGKKVVRYVTTVLYTMHEYRAPNRLLKVYASMRRVLCVQNYCILSRYL